MMKQYIEDMKEQINDQYVYRVMSNLFMPVIKNKLEVGIQIRAINLLKKILTKFDNFEYNKQKLLANKTKLENLAKQGGFNKGTFDLSAALGTIINSYDKKDSNYLLFTEAIKLTVDLLDTQKKFLMNRNKLQSNNSDDSGVTLTS